MLSNEELIKGCIKKKSRAQRQLYEVYKSRLMGLCVRYTRNREEAEDVFQEGFVRIFNSIAQLKEANRLEPWLKQTMVNTAINYYHKNKRHQGHADVGDFDGSNSDYQRIISDLTNEQLVEVVNQLPPGYKMVFNLYVIESYTHKEIGEMLNISENTSKSQLSKAKAMLKRAFKQMGIERYEKYV